MKSRTLESRSKRVIHIIAATRLVHRPVGVRMSEHDIQRFKGFFAIDPQRGIAMHTG